MIRVAVMGSTGQFGTDLVRVLKKAGNYHVSSLSHTEVECTEPVSLQSALKAIHPEVVINCAAFVRVDDCEDRIEEAFRTNTLGALYVARACAEIDAFCVYISTDYVFDGEKGQPYTEKDIPRPINIYGASKLAGEYLVQQACPRWLIVRVASLFGKVGARGKAGNFVENILARAGAAERVKVVNDIRMSPTYTYDAARALEKLLRQHSTGLFHLANAGACTWYEFAREALDLVGLDGKLEPISSADYSTRARRPIDSSLQSIRMDGLLKNDLRPWQEALEAYLKEVGRLSLSCGSMKPVLVRKMS